MATIAGQAVSKTSLPGALKEAAITAGVALILAFLMLGLHLGDIPGGVTIVPQYHRSSSSASPWCSSAGCSWRSIASIRPISRPRPSPASASGQPRRQPRSLCRSGRRRLRRGDAVHAVCRRLHHDHLDHRADLRDARLGPQHRRRPRGIARSRLRRVLRGRRLLLRGWRRISISASGNACRSPAPSLPCSVFSSVFPSCACAATISRS